MRELLRAVRYYLAPRLRRKLSEFFFRKGHRRYLYRRVAKLMRQKRDRKPFWRPLDQAKLDETLEKLDRLYPPRPSWKSCRIRAAIKSEKNIE